MDEPALLYEVQLNTYVDCSFFFFGSKWISFSTRTEDEKTEGELVTVEIPRQ